METKNGVRTFYARSREEWHKWLEHYGRSEKSVCLIVYHQDSRTPSVHLRESIEEAVCFGWVDSQAQKRDSESFYLVFTPRDFQGTWRRAGKQRAEKMIQEGLMTPQGKALIDYAKKTGKWDALVETHNTLIPADLQELFDQNQGAFSNFRAFSPASQRAILEWILTAEKPEIRRRRIEQTVKLASKNLKPLL